MPSDESSQDEVFTETPDAPSGEENQDKTSADKLAFDTPAERFYFMVSLIEAFVLRFLIRHCERLLDDDGKPDMHGISLREVLIRTGVVQQCDKEKEWLLDHGVFPQEVLDDRLAWYQAFIKKRLEANDAQGKLDILMPERIQAEFQLSDEELLILCAVAAPQINQDIMRLYRFASGLDTTIFPGFFMPSCWPTRRVRQGTFFGNSRRTCLVRRMPSSASACTTSGKNSPLRDSLR